MEMSSILSRIKKGVASSGSNRGKILYLKADSKVRVRFLHEIEDGIEVLMHDSFNLGINVPCQKLYGRDCKYCGDEDLRHREAYIWSVWDHDAKEVKLFLGFANNFNPLPSLVAMYESYGTMVDRDYVIQRNGSGMNTSYGVIPMDKVAFRNKNAKPYSQNKTLEILDKAFPAEGNVTSDEPGDAEESADKYGSKSPRELYSECVERGIDVETRKNKEYYIQKLVEDDNSDEDEWDDEWDEGDDEW